MTTIEGRHAATVREVVAFNLAATSENKIHDDAVARRLGFTGGLVPGAAVYAYMAHMPVARWGRAWLENGIAECRFRKPVYDGAPVRITSAADGERLALDVESGGLACASGEARMARGEGPAPRLGAIPPLPPMAERPPASEASLAVGRSLGIAPVVVDRAALAAYLDAVRETDPLYATEASCTRGRSCSSPIARCWRTSCLAPGSTSAAGCGTMRLRASASS